MSNPRRSHLFLFVASLVLVFSIQVNADGGVIESRITSTNIASKADEIPNKRLLVLDPTSSDVEISTIQAISGLLTVELEQVGGIDVISGNDVQRMLDLEAEKASIGCSAESCLSEIADAFGTDLVLFGTIGRLGEIYVLTLNIFETSTAKSKGRISVRTRSLENFPESLKSELPRLLGAVHPVVVKSRVQPTSSTMLPGLAVLYFDYAGKNEELFMMRKGFAQMLITDLQSVDNVVLVERERIEDIMKELQLSKSEKIDPQTAARIGSLVGARYLVVGSFFDLLGQLRVDARMVDVETGEVLGAIGKQTPMDGIFAAKDKLASDLAKIIQRNAKPVPFRLRMEGEGRRIQKTEVPVATKVVIAYSRALDAKDHGDVPRAIEILKAVVNEEPGFELAKFELREMTQ